MNEYTYKGYKIRIRRTNQISALIWPPNFPRVMNEIAHATLQEGEAVAVKRAEAIVDADLLKGKSE